VAGALFGAVAGSVQALFAFSVGAGSAWRAEGGDDDGAFVFWVEPGRERGEDGDLVSGVGAGGEVVAVDWGF